MKLKEIENRKAYKKWLSDEEVIPLIGHLLNWGGVWKKVTLMFEELDKENMVFEGLGFEYDFLSRASDVELEELDYIIWEDEDGTRLTFTRSKDSGWHIYTRGRENQLSEKDN